MHWPVELLEELCELLSTAAPDGQFLWNNQQLVHLFVPAQREPWATIHTKRTQALELVLTGPKGRFGLGRVADLGRERELHTADRDRDVREAQVPVAPTTCTAATSPTFLREHCSALNGGG